MLKIVADNAIPFVGPVFSCIGDVMLVDAKQLSPVTLKDADVLVCRTVTKVDRQLLQNSALRIVASPSSGTDHVDLEYLHQRSIDFFSAPGSNARSVAEYVLSAVCVLASQNNLKLTGKKVGIIGCGNVGSLVRDFFQTIGLQCLVYDPFRQQLADGNDFCELSAIQQADIITLHTPLTTAGPYPTAGMLDANFFRTLASDVILINTARGGVVDEQALLRFLQANTEAMAVIDVWKNEPTIDTTLLRRADIATPHIAGYSMDGKYRATNRVFEQVCERLQISDQYKGLEKIFPGTGQREISLNPQDTDIDALSLAVLASYDVRSDAAALRHMLEDDVTDRSDYFSALRNNYPVRREFSSLYIKLAKEAESLRHILQTLGFHAAENFMAT